MIIAVIRCLTCVQKTDGVAVGGGDGERPVVGHGGVGLPVAQQRAHHGAVAAQSRPLQRVVVARPPPPGVSDFRRRADRRVVAARTDYRVVLVLVDRCKVVRVQQRGGHEAVRVFFGLLLLLLCASLFLLLRENSPSQCWMCRVAALWFCGRYGQSPQTSAHLPRLKAAASCCTANKASAPTNRTSLSSGTSACATESSDEGCLVTGSQRVIMAHTS
ncbi:hypothetical protein HK100_001955 [Physocladia obscura]|uniref:Uncharacterized protein n=1 Tax=Physocladia obscura TaxID=109957 RepID=A0AAD5TDB1_9FUNG|nr:hypothetical protein HK100_001955 [Physocladia obscura]